MPVLISLVITVYNRERYLSEAIESVLAQTRQDFDLLIWDDGSTDNSVEIAKEYAKRDRRIRVVAAEHQGRTPSLKEALAQTKGSYIGLVDSDDLLAPTALEETAAVLEADPVVGLVYTDYMDIDRQGKVIGYGNRCRVPYSKERLLIDFMTFHFRLMRRQVFEQVGGFDEACAYAEDYDLCLRLSEITQIRHINKPLYYYRSHQANITNQHQIRQAQDSCKAIGRALERRGIADHCQVTMQILNKFPFKSKIKITLKNVSSLVLAALPLAGIISISPAHAQSITSAGDRVNTIVTPDGNRIDITGGRLSRDGANLFHSFNKFGLDPNQTANFVSTPSIQNILGRVNGGQASVINGLIQVTGGNSNLYLMNPAGIVFGANARLNVPADFTATTATSIGIGNGWFNAKGDNNYRDLVGMPNGFAFNTAQPGAIVNAGELAVDAGKNLALVGGTVINTGTVTAPGGNITVAAVPGESVMRLSKPGYLLSLEVPSSDTSSTQPGNWTMPILSLPQLLTGPGAEQATGVSVNSNGQVVLTSSGIQVPSDTGTTIVSGSLDTSSGQIGGRVNVLGDKVGLASANINASGDQGGGAVLIGGDYQGKGTVPNASRTYVSRDSVIAADAGVEGDGGRVIVWADGTNEFFGNISVRGGSNSGNGGFVEVSGKQNLTFDGKVDLKAEKGNSGTLLLDPVDITIVAGNYGIDDFQLFDRQILANDSPGQSFTISESALENATFTGGVTLQATNNITINNLPDNALTFVAAGNGYNPGSITFTADADGDGVGSFSMNPGDTIEALGRTITISGASVNVGSIVPSLAQGNAGSLNITATNGDIIVNGYLNATSINAQAGTITLRSPNGNITINNSALDSRSTLGNGADILLEASGNITTGTLQSNVEGNAAFNGGNITLISTAGSINTSAGIVQSFSGGGNGGVIALTAASDITAGSLNSQSAGANSKGGDININAGGNFSASSVISIWQGTTTGDGGNINITVGGDISSQGDFLTFTDNGNGGNISLTAGGNIFTDDIYSIGSLSSGNINLTSGGTIDTTLSSDGTPGPIFSCSGTGNTCSGGSGKGGNVTVEAATRIVTGINANGPLGGGDISLTSSEIDNLGVSSNGGTLLLQPFTPSQNIAIASSGDSGAGTLDLTATELSVLQNGFSSIVIGRVDGIGTITLNPFNFTAPVNIAGGSTLIGPNQNTTWTITDTNAGSISGFPNGLTFSSIQNLRGGNANDTFVFGNGITFNGAINGEAGTDTLDYSAYTTPLTVNLGTLGGVNIEQVIGTTAASSTLIGANTANTWNITGNNSGTVNGSLNFIAFGNLTGGNLDDTFQFNQGASLSGNLDGAAGNLTLTGDELNFAGKVSGTGNLTLQPLTPTQAIQIGGSDSGNSGILSLTGTKLSLLQNGFTSIAIGRADGSGAITLAGDVTFNDPVTLRSTNSSGSINYTGGTLRGADNASITLLADGNITTGNIIANPGITIVSNNGSIDTSSGILDSSALRSNGGAIALSAPDNITTSNITSRSDIAAGGNITLNSQAGAISSGNIDASGNTDGGNIAVIARNQIAVGQINSSALTGNGGNVFLDPIGDIQVDLINAQGGVNGKGGTVDVTTNQFFRALSSFTDQNGINASISTAGGTGGGDIVIRHDGGARDIPFVVGFDGGNSASNGTAGAITTGSGNSILPVQSFPGSYTQGNIQIITPNPTSSPSPQPDDNGILKDIQGRTVVSVGIDSINLKAKVLFDTTAIQRIDIDQALASGQVDKAISLIEQLRTQEFQNYFEGNLTTPTAGSASVEQTQTILSDIGSKTGKIPAVIYVFSQPDQLQLILVTPKGKPLLKTVYQANNATLIKMVRQLRSEVTDTRKKTGYQAAAKQLYQWLIAPLEAELQAQKIDTLVFSMDTGLRSLPLAVLSDGQQFLVEKYSLGVIPSINLVDTRYQDVKNSEVLAMGASKFSDQNPLPAVPVELSTIVGDRDITAQKGLWSGKSFLNQGFTLANLKSQRAQTPFGIIHLATHGEFKLGAPRNSYIQLWDTQLQLDQLRLLGWKNPPVELLVLSACRTAVGDEQAEFGFGGLAVAAGVKSAVASLWYVSDEGTLGLMSEFYQQLKTAPIKAEALRQAQIAMIKGQVKIEGGQLRSPGEPGGVPLPPELAQVGDKQLSHPAYWGAFTMIGSPW